MPNAVKRDRLYAVRLSEDELELLHENAHVLGCSTSDYVRSLMAIPVSVLSGSFESENGFENNPDSVSCFVLVVYDKQSFFSLYRQLRAWGYHYNQAVHALNVIKQKRFLSQEDAYELFTKANSYLENLQSMRHEFESRIEYLERNVGVVFNGITYNYKTAKHPINDFGGSGSYE